MFRKEQTQPTVWEPYPKHKLQVTLLSGHAEELIKNAPIFSTLLKPLDDQNGIYGVPFLELTSLLKSNRKARKHFRNVYSGETSQYNLNEAIHVYQTVLSDHIEPQEFLKEISERRTEAERALRTLYTARKLKEQIPRSLKRDVHLPSMEELQIHAKIIEDTTKEISSQQSSLTQEKKNFLQTNQNLPTRRKASNAGRLKIRLQPLPLYGVTQ